uniref:RING-type domain-containing protein n=1 Tax=Anopheles dirus TaxID=7168 RepID=A0A182NHY7_9DIPT
MEYCLLDIGVRRSLENFTQDETDIAQHVAATAETKTIEPAPSTSTARTFTHNQQKYTLIDAELNVATVLRAVRRVPEYELRERTDAFDRSTVVLGIFLRMVGSEEEFDQSCTQQRQRLKTLLFEEVARQTFIEQELEQKPTAIENEVGTAPTVQQFYNQLRSLHQQRQSNEGQGSTDAIGHAFLRPQLRPYQKQAIRWMLERETAPGALPAQYVRLRNRSLPEVDFFMDVYTGAVRDVEPPPTPLPAGGILADEMGLGKTVEILGLILNNRRPEPSTASRDGSEQSDESVNDDDDDDDDEEAELKCLCFRTNRKDTIACSKCGLLQHRKCVLKQCQPGGTASRRYICPECWRTEPMVESGATIIVSPASIKHQWESEIRKHVSDPNFRVYVYNGVTDTHGKWIAPDVLASYDVVLTDYNVLKPEIYHVAENARTSRHEKRFLIPATPLTMIRWWRVCLDEAQMVEGLNNNVTKMVKSLPTVHRWTVTGTPIEKTINNLHGLVHYLDYAPYSRLAVWNQYASRFVGGTATPLLTAMVRVMWRTCKHAVLDQLGIPPQTERVHYVHMSDLQSCFYRSEHLNCARAFHEKAQKIGREQRMAQMNIQTLNLLLEPLRKLRQDCTIPSILHVGAFSTKKLLTPAELHEHLVTANVNECKGQLRSVVSSLNGMAAIHILRHDYDQAFRYYQASLRWADDYQGAISVDSLLQIHALHNLLDLSHTYVTQLDPTRQPTPAQLQDFEERRGRLEWRYIEQYASKVRSIENALLPATEKVDEAIKRRRRFDGWWHDLLATFEKNTQRHINFQYRLLREQSLLQDTGVSSWRSLDLWLTNWLDKIVKRRAAVQKGFQSLEFFVETLRPNHLCQGKSRERIDKLVRTAFACHLDPALFEVDENGMRTDERLIADGGQQSAAPVCLLCEVKDLVNQLEVVLFLIKNSKVASGGLWQVSPQEQVLKLLHQYAKRLEPLDQGIITEGDQFLSFLERVKLEFKEYSQYWVEINYTVAAYDELTMCKSRLQLLTEAERLELEQAKKKPTLMQVHEAELPTTLQEMELAKADAERAFVRLKGTRKYLEHLGVRKEIDECPICQIIPTVKYAVLQCGHHLCVVCAMKVVKFARASGHRTSCVICRHEQHVRDIQYVTDQVVSVHNVRGNYTNKVIEILETILTLKEQDPNVKIVIFSHWEPILGELGGALRLNGIKFREKSAKFYRCVEEFKDYEQGVTCLLLPLRYGSKGLNLTEATHVFLVEPILNPGEELQAVGRVHRIGQTRPTFVHRFIVLGTIEETIHETIKQDHSGRWLSKDVTVEQLEQLFRLDDGESDEMIVQY